MCELFGFYANKEKRLQPYLTEFFRHSVRHPNGWGLATFENGEPNVRTEMISAEKSRILPDIVNSLPDVICCLPIYGEPRSEASSRKTATLLYALTSADAHGR